MKATHIGKAVWIVNSQKIIVVNTRNVPMKMILPEVSEQVIKDVKKIKNKTKSKNKKSKS
ncbi:MAG: hypothetical protein HN576_05410 [Bacteriovoracaceae bacterium]|jgi:hypothetical protein|nr:hypothetical protein [Bacteriovoracaceae bacterium]